MLEEVRDYIARHRLIPEGERVVAGVSGGIDSMVLLHVLLDLGYAVHVAHVNYQLRGDESERDAQMVASYCEKRGIPFQELRADPGLEETEGSSSFQDRARRIRYAFFEEQAAEAGIGYVAVGHHRDDQAETVLLRLMQGSGMEGLSGIQPSRLLSPQSAIRLVRPLLDLGRDRLRSYAAEHAVPWREDRTNEALHYRRNEIRHRLMPMARSIFGEKVGVAIARSAHILRRYWEDTVGPELEKRFQACSEELEPAGGMITLSELTKYPDVWQSRLIMEAMYTWLPDADVVGTVVQEVLKLIDAQVGRKVYIPGGTIWRERDALAFLPVTGEETTEVGVALHLNQSVFIDSGTLEIRPEEDIRDPRSVSGPKTIVVDRAKLSFPLNARRWQPGDRMVPIGMSGHKKVSDILTDEKVPSHGRDHVHVLESNDEIIWVIGVRMGDSVKIDRNTTEAVRITYHPAPKNR